MTIRFFALKLMVINHLCLWWMPIGCHLPHSMVSGLNSVNCLQHYSYRSQERHGVIHTVLHHNITVCVYKDPKMAPVKRHAYDADFKLKAISHAVEHGNRAAAREFNINESMVRKWRKQEDDLRQV